MPEAAPQSVAAYPRRHSRKWLILIAFWIVQALGIYLISPVWIDSANNVDPGKGNLGSISWGGYWEVLTSADWVKWWVIDTTVITAAQLILMLPVRKPG